VIVTAPKVGLESRDRRWWEKRASRLRRGRGPLRESEGKRDPIKSAKGERVKTLLKACERA